MNPQVLALLFFILEEAIKLEPAIADEVRSLLNKTDPTPEDWALLRAKVAAKSYADYVPATALRAEPPAAAPIPAVTAAPVPPPAPAPVPAPLEEAAPISAPVQVFTGQAVDPHA